MKISDRILHKLYLLTRKHRFSMNQNALKRKDFTIISNNCWGGDDIGSVWFAKE